MVKLFSMVLMLALLILPLGTVDLERPADGENFNYATNYTRVGMVRTLDCYTGNEAAAAIYNSLQYGRLREVSEPETPYGSLFEVYDYYMEQYILGFSEAAPQYARGSGENAVNADLSFTVYAMLEGAPEFGEDSRYLLYDQQTGKWYVFAADYYNILQDLLEKYEPESLDYVSA